MNKQKILILILSLLVLVAVIYLVVDKIIDPAIERKRLENYNEGVLQGTLELAYTQTTNAVLYYFNESGALNSIGLSDYCNRGLGGQ